MPPLRSRLAALGALVATVGVVASFVVLVVQRPLWLLGANASFALSATALFTALVRRRFRRTMLALAAVCVVAGFVLLVVPDPSWAALGLATAMALTVLFGYLATRWEIRSIRRHRWAPAPAATRPFLVVNPQSGDGEGGALADEARSRGITVEELGPDSDLAQIVREAIADGVDVVGVAGGDGSQALVASVAAEAGVEFVCIPAGTRNHLALDLGLDRDDPEGSLAAFGPARRGTIDLARVNDSVFVNNVSLGVYAEIVSSDEYREAKTQTIAEMLPDLMGPDAPMLQVDVTCPNGEQLDPVHVILVSNNRYRYDGLAGLGTRARLDEGVIGMAALRVEGGAGFAGFLALQAVGAIDSFPGWTEWTAPELEIRGSGEYSLAVDGEATKMKAPFLFQSMPGALTVRIPVDHPGVGPALRRAGFDRRWLRVMTRLVRGRSSGLVTSPGG